MKRDFQDWKSSYLKSGPQGKPTDRPKCFNRKEYNKRRRQIAAKLKKLIPNDIELEFWRIVPEDRLIEEYAFNLEQICCPENQ